ncbi:hypothetical protein Goari_003035 [Gossypium aridum]|uniref:Neprosin PEP catalytic domain-containing protein n=1 Tax=Gossypium aridum TaxID=34290 RepID=A0A7J8YAB5_GOSAI|nr:hypothetical protein [Gossypium aridum]
MASCFSMARVFLAFLVVASSLGHVFSSPLLSDSVLVSSLLQLALVTWLVRMQSPDGDVIDCVLSHLQPAFDHPALQGQKPHFVQEDPPGRPNGYKYTEAVAESESFQLWADSGESCPEGTVPIRRTRQKDIQRASSITRYGRRRVRRDSTGSGHEHAVAFEKGDEYYGAKASLNVWAPRVSNEYEFSLSQIWIISGSFGNDLNTIEAGWQACPWPKLLLLSVISSMAYMNNYRIHSCFFRLALNCMEIITLGSSHTGLLNLQTDAYRATGCYNLLCSGFIQTNNKVAIGAAISPTSSYNGRQFEIGLMVWKDPKHGNWWLELGSGMLVGYWPAILFSHLRSHANMIQFGGEIVNSRSSSSGLHTSTQMGSGHFAQQGFGKAAYFRNLQRVDWDNNLLPMTNLRLLADHSNCYDITQGRNNLWGTYFYYGGPGRNVRCP